MASAFAIPPTRSRHFFLLRFPALFLVLAWLSAPAGWGHADLEEAIAALDRKIAASGDEARLFLQRGELHRKHGDWTRATADYDRAAALDPSLAAVDLARGALELGFGRVGEATTAFGRFIRNKPDDPAGFVARARLLRGQRDAGAAADFARAVARSREPSSELYLEWAGALRETGRAGEAVAVLDEGTKRLGPLVTFVTMALDLEIELVRTDAALHRVNALIAAAPRKEGWLKRRGAILEKAGRVADARADYELARAAIATLSEHRRGTEAVRTLYSEIEAALRRLPP